MLSPAAILVNVFSAVILSLILVSMRVMGFLWCPVRFVAVKFTVSRSSVGSMLRIAFRTLSVSSVACAVVLMSMYAIGC